MPVKNKNKKDELLKFDADGNGKCRQCNRKLGQRDKRNFRAGVEKDDQFMTAAIIVNETAIRCPFCFCRNVFEPFVELQTSPA